MPSASKKNPLNIKAKILSKNLFPVVGIGASAGGLEAFKKLLNAIPEKSGMAYILVQHLSPDHESSLPEILQRETKIPVHEISNNIEVKPDNIYIIPSNKVLTATDGVLNLSPRPDDHKNMPIDVFFTSLADVHQGHSIGIILSGSGSDGTMGLRNIKDHGGITFAQDPASAAFGDMPQSAIAAEVVDFILAPERMPQQLLDLDETMNRGFSSGGNPLPEGQKEEDAYRQVLAQLRLSNGVDFNNYKQTTIRRRILRRMALLKIENFIGYRLFIIENKEEQDLLFNDLLIRVTNFFRDPGTFDYLCEKIFPELLKNKLSNTVRIWIAGCATGEEAYSIGISLYEYLNNKDAATRVQIFATDVSEKAIAIARKGIYDKRQLEGVSDTRLQHFFTRIDGHYQVQKNIRDMCVFGTHNFLKDPPFAKIDLVSCRNVLIYMDPVLQKKALNTFHYSLNEKGFLLLGKSETIGNSELFHSLAKKEKLFTRNEAPGRWVNVASGQREEDMKDNDYSIRSSEQKKDDFQKKAEDVLLSRYTPPGVIVNEQFDVVQFRGSTREYLEPSPGKANLNILKMAREGLSFELRNALHKAKTSKQIYSKKGIAVNSGKNGVTIEVVPLPGTNDLHFLILFREEQVLVNPQLAPDNNRDGHKQAGTTHKNNASEARIDQLEKELLSARENMRSITEDQEAFNEELQSANEELLSGSEELQTMNEELETSKEELQSTNEELVTVNQELYDRTELYNQARLYAEAIVATIHEPLLVLDKDFIIQSANPAFYTTFQITEEETLEKVLFELQDTEWDIPGFRSHLLKIQVQKEKSLDWELAHSFPRIGKRIICFNARPFQRENGESRILLTMEDITERKLLESRSLLSTIVDNSNDAIMSKKLDGIIMSWNKSAEKIFGYTKDEIVGKNILLIIPPDLYHEEKMIISKIKNGEDIPHFNTVRLTKSGKRINVSVTISPIKDNEGKVIGASI
ncbi:MAG TPA: chemotaxis protein CheB, partial [Hanamia sp.]